MTKDQAARRTDHAIGLDEHKLPPDRAMHPIHTVLANKDPDVLAIRFVQPSCRLGYLLRPERKFCKGRKISTVFPPKSLVKSGNLCTIKEPRSGCPPHSDGAFFLSTS